MKHSTPLSIALLSAIMLPAGWGQAQVGGKSKSENRELIRLDPEFDRIVSPSSKMEKLADGFGFIEGPVWNRSGKYLLFSDIPHNVVNKWSKSGKISVFLEKSGYGGTDLPTLPSPLTRANFLPFLLGSDGLTFDHKGRLILCEHGNRQVERLEKDGSRTVIADRWEGKKLNSPNDVIVKSDDSIYFTDPFSSTLTTHPQAEIPFAGIYRVKNGKMDLLIKDLRFPNGLAFSPDEKFLYVDDSRAKTYIRYEVQADGTLANGKIFYDVSKEQGIGVPDGMKVDKKGDLFATGPGGAIWVFNSSGKVLGKIKPPDGPANLAWGDSDGKTLYICAFNGLYRIRLKVSGRIP